ncbi:MAG: hypothetical protein JXR76_20090, partial [Deltaproteobacteria bacterium]|nr:hypothetical protein [Deltaproteobacteria bacterium]
MTNPGSQEAYEACLNAYMAINDSKVVFCNMPLEIATAEGRGLSVVSTADRQVLVDAGLNPELVDSLPTRAEGFAYAAARYQLATTTDPISLQRWKEAAPKGYEVRKYLFKFLAFAYRDFPALLQALNKIREGRGHRDMIMDLLALHILATENPDPLMKIPMFDQSKVALAKVLYSTLGDLLARSSIDPKEAESTKNIMNRAWTFYKMAADEVKLHGQFVFEGTEHYQNYVSEYQSKLGKQGAKASQAILQQTEDETDTPPPPQ